MMMSLLLNVMMMVISVALANLLLYWLFYLLVLVSLMPYMVYVILCTPQTETASDTTESISAASLLRSLIFKVSQSRAEGATPFVVKLRSVSHHQHILLENTICVINRSRCIIELALSKAKPILSTCHLIKVLLTICLLFFLQVLRNLKATRCCVDELLLWLWQLSIVMRSGRRILGRVACMSLHLLRPFHRKVLLNTLNHACSTLDLLLVHVT